MNIAIIGFGRIGRLLTRQLSNEKKIKIKLIIDLFEDVKNLTYLLNYDSTYGVLKDQFFAEKNFLCKKKNKIPYISSNNISLINWKKYQINTIIDCTGDYQNIFKAKKILRKYSKIKYLATHSNPMIKKDIIYGLNHKDLKKKDNLISSSICDVNAISHPLSWMEKNFKILGGSVTTLHPWLSYQNLLDGPAISTANKNVIWKDYALGRSSISNLIPKNTTVIRATEKILPSISNKLLSFSFRIPTQAVCAADITLRLKEKNLNKIKKVIIENTKRSKIVKINYEQITSIDLLKSEFSATIDMRWLKMQDDVLKIVLWYDNEWGYTARVKDIIKYIEQKRLY